MLHVSKFEIVPIEILQKFAGVTRNSGEVCTPLTGAAVYFIETFTWFRVVGPLVWKSVREYLSCFGCALRVANALNVPQPLTPPHRTQHWVALLVCSSVRHDPCAITHAVEQHPVHVTDR